MNFLAPVAFATAAMVVPALLILYFLKLRRREEAVPSTLLWKRAVQDLQVNAPFQRLRKNLLLFLQLLILLAGVVALARPIIKSTASEGESIVILLDRSASMKTREGNETRFEQAKEQAVRLVKTLNRTGSRWFSFAGPRELTRAMVIAFSDRATVVSPFTTNTTELVELIRGLEPTDGQTNLREALQLAEAYMRPSITNDVTAKTAEAPSKLVLISDGGVADLKELVLRGGKMEWLKIGATRNNAGITSLRAQRNYEKPEVLSTFLQVCNFSAEPTTLDVSLYVDGRIPEGGVKTITLAPGGSRAEAAATQPIAGAPAEGSIAALSFEFVLNKSAVLEARLSRDDALMVDNYAYAVVPSPRKLRVLLVSAGNRFLESVLRGLPLQQLKYLTPAQYEAAPADELEENKQSKYDVVVFDKHQPAKPLPAGNYLFLATTPKLNEIKVKEPAENFAILWWDETHPVLRHVALEYVYVSKGLSLEMPKESETLIEGPAGPVLTRYSKNGVNSMILTFAIENSTWWNKPGFPIFMYNTLQYLGGGGAAADQGPTRPGGTLRIPLPAGAKEAKLVRPDNSTATLTPDEMQIARYGGTDLVGIYRVEPGLENQDRFAVNLEDEVESDIGPPADLVIGSQKVDQTEAIKTATPEIWRWFIGTALLIALLEWYIYNRRVMV